MSRPLDEPAAHVAPLELTGERTVPDVEIENHWFLDRFALSGPTSSQPAAKRCDRSFVGNG